MSQDKDQYDKTKSMPEQTSKDHKENRPSPFTEPSRGEGESNNDPSEEAKLEQERKEAMTERD